MPEQTLPVGRLVYGHPSKKIPKLDQKRQPVLKDGQPVLVHMFGVAYPKQVFNDHIWPIMYQAASAAFGGQQPPPHFAYKFKDGDGVDRQGRPYNQREGYAGHIVIHFETQLNVTAFRQNPQTGGWDQITENDYKTGDYVAVNCNIEGNKPSDPTHTPGLFINPVGVLHIGNGTAIVNAPSADQMFGGQQFALPPGATAPGSAPPMPAGMANPPGFGGAMPPGGMAPPPAPGTSPAAPGYPAAAAPQPAQPIYQPQPAAPGGYAPQPAQPVYQQPPAAAPAAPGVPGPTGYPPAHDFVQNATGLPPGGYAPQPAPAAPVPGAPPAGYPMPPGGMPPR